MLIPSMTGASAPTVSPANRSGASSAINSTAKLTALVTATVAPSLATSLATNLANTPPPPTYEQEYIRHMLFGSLSAVQSTIRLLYALNYAEPNDWSQPISTGRPNEVMAILTKRVRL